MTTENNFHFGVGHFCAGCPLSNVLHKDCPMVVVKNTPPEISGKQEDKAQPLTITKSDLQNPD